MKIKYLTAIILIFLSLYAGAISIGPYPGLSKLIDKADAIVVLRIDRHLSDFGSPTLLSTHECFVYQTLKGDIPEGSRIKLRLMHTQPGFVAPFSLLSTHLIFLYKTTHEDEQTDYRSLQIEGANIPLSSNGHEKEPEGNTIEEKVKNLIRDAIKYQAEEHLKRRTFLMFMINELESLEQPPEGQNIRFSGYDVIPLPMEKTSEMFEVFRLDTDVDLNLVYQALIALNITLRAEAAKYLGTNGDETSIPHLLDALSDESSHGGSNPQPAGMSTTRYWANDSLKKLTGQDFGFIWDDPFVERNKAIKKWQAWYLKTLKTTN